MNLVTSSILAILLTTLATTTTPALAASRYETAVTQLEQMAAASPSFAQMVDLGTNDQGLVIRGLRIEDPDVSGDKVKHLVVGAHHGNETLSVTLALRFANDLLAQLQDVNAPHHASLAPHIYYVFPVLNISGYNANRREESYRNGGTLDSNRDYPDPCGSDTPFQLKSTKLISEFIDSENIIGAVTIHGYYGSFTYPWGTFTTQSHTLDHDLFRSYGLNAVVANNYTTGTHGDVIYPTVGAFEDWAYYQHGVWVMLVEMDRNANIGRDSESLLRYFSTVPTARSLQHEHTGRCRSLPSFIIGRP